MIYQSKKKKEIMPKSTHYGYWIPGATLKTRLMSFFLIIITVFVMSDLPTSTTGQKLYDFRCSDNYTQSAAYQSNLKSAVQNITVEASLKGSYTTSVGQGYDTVYAGYYCRGDIDGLPLCAACVSNATRTIMQTCPEQIAAVVWYDLCQVGFSPAPFSDKYIDVYKIAIRSNDKLTGNATLFASVVNVTLLRLAGAAANDTRKGLKFATAEASVTGQQRVYTLAQCAPYLSRNVCDKCLVECVGMLPTCCRGRNGGRVLFPSCNLRYEVYKFYDLANNSAAVLLSREHQRKNRTYIAAIVSIAIVMVLLLICVAIIFKRRNKTTTHHNVDMNEITSADSLQFDFNQIRAATQNFSPDNMLGQGGFGPVYKGKLENGQEIAVKRLSETSGQGGAEFKTEVLLVAKLQHRNLVKLLGFCLSGKEKILVYEFLPNSSLDRFLSDPTKRASLDWATRFKIICGIAKGMLYLHEDSRLKIVHRDLKSSNILLDEDMNPKISDFGLAKLFGVDQTQDDTNRIVGTYGYMAPEYVLTGHFSVKSDVYSFGIIVLELVSGQKNRFFNRNEDEEALLFKAWKLWNEGVAVDLVDPILNNNYSSEEVTRCVQIGLLCIQEGAPRRPKMASVVSALTGQQSVALPDPTPPNFFSSSASTSTTNTMTANLTSTTSTSQTTSELLAEAKVSRNKTFGDGSDYSGFEDITECYPR